jgi:hypothetical protein
LQSHNRPGIFNIANFDFEEVRNYHNNKCLSNFEVRKEITNNRCPSFILFITRSPSTTQSSKIDLSYPEVLLSLEPKLHPTTKRPENKYPSQVDQVILSTHHHQNPEYMATNA